LGNFLVTIALQESRQEAKRSFDVGLESARKLLGCLPNQTMETPWANIALFPRLNGSQASIANDAQMGSWLFAIGSWFHTHGYSTGDEARLLQRYCEVGPQQLGRELEGFFVLVAGDARFGEVTVLTDVVGSCGCFYRKSDVNTALSGSSLLLASAGRCSMDQVGCQEYLRTGIIYEDRTLYEEVRKLGPALFAQFRVNGELSRQRYWSVNSIATESIRGPDAASRLWSSLTSAAQRIGGAFTRPLCDLTGGYDSRALVSAFWAAGVPVSTVVSGPKDSADVVLSRRLASVAGLPHLHNPSVERTTFSEVAEALPFTDGEYDLIEYSRILQIHRSMMARFDVSINGSFGELARGYWWELLFPRAGARTRLDGGKVGRVRFGATADDPSLFAPRQRLDLGSHFAEIIERTNAGLFERPNTLQMDHAYLAMRMQRWQGRIASSTNRIWPCLSPFMFKSVLETMLAIQVRLRRRGVVIRQMLARFRPQWAAVPLEHGYPAVPATWRTAHKFLPALGHYGQKAWSKVGRKLQRESSRTPAVSGPPIRIQLWSEEQVRALLDLRTMLTRGFLETQSLQFFLERSQKADFPFDAEWRRLLSLEYTLRTLKSSRPED
jgi:hypothetical protein